MNDTLHLTLPDGRLLAYAEYGDPSGFPIFGFHGTPGSRLWFSEDNQALYDLNIRFLTIDRPGYGQSTPKPKRTILGFVEDVVALANHLGLDQYSVMGVSGGGVYAAACAYMAPERLLKAGLVATINNFENGRPPKEMAQANKSTFWLARRMPWLLRYMMGLQKKMIDTKPADYIAAIQHNVGHLCPFDQQMMARPEVAQEVMLHMKEAFRQGTKEAVREAALVTRPWGFESRQISTPVEVWHGTADTMAPVGPIRKLSMQIPYCQSHFLDDKGHFLTEEEATWRAILASLKA